MFACEHFGVSPDLMCLAKAMGGGLPVGAVLCSERVTPPTGRHGTTFGGNPLSCAAALAAIEAMIDEDLAAQAREKGDWLVARLREAPLGKVREIRHKGLMIGIEVREPAVPLVLALVEAGVLTFPAGSSVIRVFPPLTIERELLEVVADRLARVL
jgi:acetylornithine/succinyldiaminopimelate/putrescine aminotransferase